MESDKHDHSSCEDDEDEDEAKYDDFLNNPSIVDKYQTASVLCKGTYLIRRPQLCHL